MSSDSEAQAAITALNGTQLGGRTLTVNEARPSRATLRWRGRSRRIRVAAGAKPLAA